MANDAPDWTRKVIVAVTVEEDAVIPEVDNEVAAGDVGNYSGTDTSYQSVAKWTVTADKVGELKEILLISDDYDHTAAQVTIAGTVFVTAWSPTAAMPLIFEDLKLDAADEVEVEVKSSDGTSIDVDVIIIGKEIG